MKNLIYIGNKSNNKNNTNLSSIDLLEPLLVESGYNVFSASNKKNIVARLFHMLWICMKYRNKVDYVLIDTYSTLNFYYAYFVSQLCRMLKLKYFPFLHGGNLPSRLKTSPRLSKAIFKNAYINVAPSLYTKANFDAFDYSNVLCIPNSIEIKNYPFKVRSFDKVNLLWVRSFSKIYNPLLAIKLLKALKDQNIEANLCMVGPENDGTLQKAKDLSLELNVDVTFTGKLSKQEWISLSKDYNIFISTTNFDNMPVSVMEAMALGLPVISTNVGGMPFLIKNDVDGVLVNPNNVNEFVNAILRLTNQPKKATQLALDARKKVERFDWSIVKHKWLSVLQ